MVWSALAPAAPTPGGEGSGKTRLPSSLKVQEASRYGDDREEDVEAWLFMLEELFDLTRTMEDDLRIKFLLELFIGVDKPVAYPA